MRAEARDNLSFIEVRAGGMASTQVESHRRRFRDLIMAPEILVLPGAWDGLSALLIEQAGLCCKSTSKMLDM